MIWRVPLTLTLLIALIFGATWLRSPPALLDLIDRAWPSAARRVAHDVGYAGGERQSLDIWTVPDGRRDKPVLIFWYGGGWVKGAKEDYGFAARAYAAKGFVVVLPDYRLVPQVRFPAFVEDGQATLKWVQANIARYGGDPRRITVSGHSAGAYIAAMVALAPGSPVRAAAPLSGPYDFFPYTGRAIAAFAGSNDPRVTQPIAFVRAGAPPMMLVTGTADTTVRPRNARNLALALTKAGGHGELREYAGLGHEDVVMALSRPYRGRASVLDDTAAFLLRYSGRKSGTDR